MNQFTETYYNFCEKTKSILDGTYADVYVQKRSYKAKYTITEDEHEVTDAQYICQKHDNKKPEIRTMTEAKMLKEIAADYNLTYIPADIFIERNSMELRHITDTTPVPAFINSAVYTHKNKQVIKSLYDKEVPYNTTRFFLYNFQLPNPIIKFVQPGELIRTKIVCQIKKPDDSDRKQNDYLLKITAHMCTKDYEDIRGMTEIITKEATLFEPVKHEQNDAHIITLHDECTLPPCRQCTLISTLKDALRNLTRAVSRKANVHAHKTQTFIMLKLVRYERTNRFSWHVHQQ
jgi:hypothetical protein